MSTVQTKSTVPEEPRLQIFGYAHDLFSRFPHPVKRGLHYLVLGISPEVPVTLTEGLGVLSVKKIFAAGFLIAFVLSFGVIAAWTSYAGTFWGSDPAVLYFARDYPNLINYTLIVPTYVGLGAVLLACVLWGWKELRQFAPRGYRRQWAIGVVALLASLIAGLLTANYMAEILNVNVYQRRYWFVEHQGETGLRVIGGLGVYYAILNYSLLLFTLLAMAGFFAMLRLGLEIGREFSRMQHVKESSLGWLRAKLSSFTRVYIAGKALIAVYMLNAYTWKWERPEESLNMVLMGTVLTAMGLVIVAVPRYYIELQWYRLKLRSPKLDETRLDQHDDIRPRNFQLWAHVLDVCIISGFLGTFWFL